LPVCVVITVVDNWISQIGLYNEFNGLSHIGMGGNLIACRLHGTYQLYHVPLWFARYVYPHPQAWVYICKSLVQLLYICTCTRALLLMQTFQAKLLVPMLQLLYNSMHWLRNANEIYVLSWQDICTALTRYVLSQAWGCVRVYSEVPVV